ncbi:MAG: glycosyltransferase [Acidobacteria bacterium]|uniref:Glycosyltransferase n=1 Tax=Candidatus Polarisedimenticola svalbardensis TaxID=2886004 RepID=A0A8J6XSB0_9BACT|nr:glycosyltransferase [Candidatus Polarisedimenticola svalbardensis]
MNFSIITATLNSGATIAACLDSVREQGMEVEHIVIDGASTDSTLEVIRSVAGDHVSLVSEPDRGIYDGMNKGLVQATGEIVGILNSDDVYSYGSVLKDVAAVFKDPKVDCCYGDLVYVEPDDLQNIRRYWKSGPFNPSRFYRGWMPPHPTFFVRRACYDDLGHFDLALGSAADYELMLRFLLRHRLNVRYIPKILVRMRTRGVSNASLENRLLANRHDRQAWRENGLKPNPLTLYLKPIRKIGQYVMRPREPLAAISD